MHHITAYSLLKYYLFFFIYKVSELDNLRVCAVKLGKQMQIYMLQSVLHYWKNLPRHIKEIRNLVTQSVIQAKLKYQTTNYAFRSCMLTYSSVKVCFLLLEESSLLSWHCYPYLFDKPIVRKLHQGDFRFSLNEESSNPCISHQCSIYYCTCGKKHGHHFLKTVSVYWKE